MLVDLIANWTLVTTHTTTAQESAISSLIDFSFFFYLCPENWTWFWTVLSEVSDPKPWKEKVTYIQLSVQLYSWNEDVNLFIVQSVFTLGRAPVTPANRHRKNLETWQVVWKFNITVKKEKCVLQLHDHDIHRSLTWINGGKLKLGASK